MSETNSIPKKNCSNEGFTLLEVVIALSIFAVGLLALANMQFTGIKGNATAHVVTAEVAVGTGIISRILALSGDTTDDKDNIEFDTDNNGTVDITLTDFLEPDGTPVNWPLSDSNIDGAGDCIATVTGQMDPTIGVGTYNRLTQFTVTVTNSSGKSVTQQIIKRRY